MAGDHEGRTLEVRIRKRLAELLHGLRRALADLSRVEVELNLEIDVRLGGRDLRDLLTLAQRERPGVAVAQRLDEADLLCLDGRIGLRSARQRAGQGLRL